MRFILQMQRDRRTQDGKESSFYVRGRRVLPQKIERFRQRKGLRKDLDMNPAIKSACESWIREEYVDY